MNFARKVYAWAASKVTVPFAPLWFGLLFLLFKRLVFAFGANVALTFSFFWVLGQ